MGVVSADACVGLSCNGVCVVSSDARVAWIWSVGVVLTQWSYKLFPNAEVKGHWQQEGC
jgi:hypothetical protein